MKRVLLIVSFALAAACGSFAAVNAMNGVSITTSSTIMGVTPVSAVMGQTVVSGGTVYLGQQDFTNGSGNTPGAPTTGNSWSVPGGTWTFNNTSPALPQGGNNAKSTIDFGGGSALTTFTSQTVVYGYFQFQWSGTLLSARNLRSFRDSGGNIVVRTILQTDGRISILNSNFEADTTVDAMATDTNYQIWFSYDTVAHTMTVGFSVDGTRPTSGNKYKSVANSVTTAVEQDLIEYSADVATFYYDHVLVNGTQIGNSP